MNSQHQYPGFEGKIERTREQSTPWWAPVAKAKAGSPNVVVIYMDDMGYSDVGCFGSEISTPNIDALAQRGVRFNNYTTHPICSPARAALLTGRNAHSVNTGWLSNNNPGFPGYSGDLPFDTPTMAENFRAAGYSTIGIGKWHNSSNSATPNASWPTSRGFDKFYGFLEGETSYFFPARIVINNVVAPIDTYPPDYYATDDWTDNAIRFMLEARNDRAEQPFFLYLAYNAVHGPLQAKEVDLAKYRGKYDEGWDVLRERRLAKQKLLGIAPANANLSPRDDSVPAWSSLPSNQRDLYVRHMETYAAMLDCVDQNVGRLVSALEQLGELDNTIVVFSADNGGTSSAGPHGNVHFNRRFAGLGVLPIEVDLERKDLIGSGQVNALYPMGWGQVSNTPFPSYKTYTGGGGRRVSCIMSWPKGIAERGAIRQQFAHVTDVMPTLMDLCGVTAMLQCHGQTAKPVHGASLAAVMRDNAPAPRTEQYYECWANRAYYRDGWVAVSLQDRGKAINFDNWTLHRLADDFSESVNLASAEPQRLRDMVEAFDAAAWANMVYPLDNRTPLQKFNQIPPHMRPASASVRRFLPGGQTVNRTVVVPLVADRNFTIRVNLQHEKGDQGVLFALGDVAGGFVVWIEDGQLRGFYNGFGDYTRMNSMPLEQSISKQFLSIAFDYQALGARRGQGRLRIVDAAQNDFQAMSPSVMNGFHEGLDIGIDRRAPVDWDLYRRKGAGFAYTGQLIDLVIESGAFAADSGFAKG